MKPYQKDRLWLCLWILCYLLLAVSILLMAMDIPPTSALRWVPGGLFWISLLGGLSVQIVLTRRRHQWYHSGAARRGRFSRGIGMLMFFKNRYAAVADLTAIISLCALVISLWLTRGYGFASYLCMAVFVFAFSMHGILNGKIFYYVMHRDAPSCKEKNVSTNSIENEGEEDND